METVKVTLRLPESLWRVARIEALDAREPFQEIVRRALEQYLKSGKKKGGTP